MTEDREKKRLMLVIRSSSPARCGIVGNPTDGYGGTVISCSMAERAYVEVRPCDCLRLNVSAYETVLSVEEDFSLRGDYFDIPRTVLTYLDMKEARLELRAWSDIPFQAGLAGSTAMFAAIFGALAAFKGIKPNRYEIAEHLHKIERELLHIQCGFQDQYMTVFGGLNYMEFRDKQWRRAFEEQVFACVEPLAAEVPALPFIVAHTGKQRVSGTMLKPIRLRWEDGERAVVEGYERIAELARIAKRAFISGQWEKLGALMNENHQIQQSLGASGEANDRLIRTALEAGAQGAKLAGAGGGGTIIALAADPEPVIAALKAAGATRILFPRPSAGLEVRVENEADTPPLVAANAQPRA